MNLSYVVIILLSICFVPIFSDLKTERDKMLEEEFKMSVGGSLVLNFNETKLNEVLMTWKHEEIDYAFANPKYNNFSKGYFDYKDDMKKSKVYQIITKMPKGANLHVHSKALLGPDFLINITYKENLFICLENMQFQFALEIPKSNCENWERMSDVRRRVNVTKFDSDLRKNFTLVGIEANDKELAWHHFSRIFWITSSLILYRPVWEEYLYQALKEFKDDNIMYLELRYTPMKLYELDGTVHNEINSTNITIQVIERFKKDYPDFFGAKLITSCGRNVKKPMEELLNSAKELKRAFPNFVVGFDLVGREDRGRSLAEYLTILEEAGKELDYFFHAGETNWYGTAPDENLVDAVLLGSKRIGHAYALLKHPAVLAEVVRRHVALEANVVSNSVLGLGRDVRAHPLAAWLAAGLPVTLASDDPGLWEAAPLSADFYVAFVGVASRTHDLRLLKQLALNSIRYSALSPTEKEAALKKFNEDWKKFVYEFISNADT